MKRRVFGIKEDGIDYIKRPGVYGICFQKKASVLSVAVINTPRGYFLPGGGIELNEDHDTCLKREFIEETGRLIDIMGFVGESDQVGFTPRTKRYLELLGNFYLVRILENVGGKVEDDHKLEWLEVEEAKDSMHLEYQSYAISEATILFKSKYL